MPGYGWSRGRKFGWHRGFGYRGGFGRWFVSQQIGDPERMMFGMGPCGEYAYQQYKRMKQQKIE
ncbi:MAG: hypothetical protein J7L45_00040 [Candidatus Aenigmarchaeota archaeon]|nr:hypothetical protein [Candidatus Aenigmarchaeota archaeon]